MNGREVTLGRLEPRTQFRLAAGEADPRIYELVAHAQSSSVVRRVADAEQVELVDGDGEQLGARGFRPTERWAPETRVVVR